MVLDVDNVGREEGLTCADEETSFDCDVSRH